MGSTVNKENSEETVVTEVLLAVILDGPDLLEVLETTSPPSMTQYKWKKQPFKVPDTTFKGKLEEDPSDERLMTPYKFFQKMLTDEMIDNTGSKLVVMPCKKKAYSYAQQLKKSK